MTTTELKCPSCGTVTAHQWGSDTNNTNIKEYLGALELIIKSIKQEISPTLVTEKNYLVTKC